MCTCTHTYICMHIYDVYVCMRMHISMYAYVCVCSEGKGFVHLLF